MMWMWWRIVAWISGHLNYNAVILEVQISTFGPNGLKRVGEMALPRVAGVRYLVSLQNPDNLSLTVPSSLDRPDVEIFEHADRGLSVNRNAAIEHSDADVILIADDDLEYTAEGLSYVKRVFDENPSLDFATFCYDGDDRKVYPEYEFDIKAKLPSGYYLTSFELAIRRRSLGGLRFSPHMGVGAPLFGSGEENVFMYKLTLKGLKGRFFPKVSTIHAGLTTGSRGATARSLQGQGAWLWIRYGWLEGFLRLMRDVPRRNAPLFKALRYEVRGFFLAYKYFHANCEEKFI